MFDCDCIILLDIMSEEQVTEEQQQQTPSEVAKKLGNEVKLHVYIFQLMIIMIKTIGIC